MVKITGDKTDESGKPLTEEVELWLRDPLECIQHLVGNPAFKESISYVPERVYTDSIQESHRYDEMWTADWWWDVQVCTDNARCCKHD
jgi:hypothetical protein